jgi:hypothetical protein
MAGILACASLAVASLGLPAAAQAAKMTFGSTLSVPATLDDANNLAYTGGNGAHHDGADTALWNPAQAAPANGQVLSVNVEGCAEPAPGGPPPLTQFHFQSLVPLADGGATVSVTSQPFDLPVCGAATPNGAPAASSTITTYQPTNMCVAAGGFVDFNDEGGFDPRYYPSGVPYLVIGSAPGATMNSYIAADGTNNGDALSALNVTATNGFAANPGQEMLLQATLGTGSDSISACGSPAPVPTSGNNAAGAFKPTMTVTPRRKPLPGEPGGPPGVKITPRTEHVTKARTVGVAIFCAQRTKPCTGTLTLTKGAVTLVTKSFTGKADATDHISLRLSPAAARLVRKAGPRGIASTLTVTLTGQAPVRGTITLIALT